MSEKATIKISVIIPVYNGGKYLKQCLDSVINQTLKEIEIICVNDGSTDETMDILNEYAENDYRVHIVSQKNSGAGVARNRGLTIAQGEYIKFVDSDDFIESFACEKLYLKAKKFRSDIILFDADLYFEDLKQFKKADWILRKDLIPSDGIISIQNCRWNFFLLSCGGPCNKLFRRKFILETGIAFSSLKSVEDVPFVYLSMAQASAINVLPEILEHYRKCEHGNTLSSQIDLYPSRIFDSYSELKQLLEKQGIFDRYETAFCVLAAENLISNYKNIITKQYTKTFFARYFSRKASFLFNIRKRDILNYLPCVTRLKIYKILYNLNLYKSISKKILHDPLVSLVVPVHNGAKYLFGCIETIIDQTFQNFELIFIDNYSTDETLDILRKYEEIDQRFSIFTQNHLNVWTASNNWLDNIKGKFILFPNLYDIFSSTYIEELLINAEKKHSDVVICETLISGGDSALVEENFSHIDLLPRNVLFRKSFLMNVFQKIDSEKDTDLARSAVLASARISVVDRSLVRHQTNYKPPDECLPLKHNYLYSTQKTEGNSKIYLKIFPNHPNSAYRRIGRFVVFVHQKIREICYCCSQNGLHFTIYVITDILDIIINNKE